MESYIDEERHLIIKLSDGSVIDAGYIDVSCEHSLAVDSAVAATCTESGLTEGSHCSICQAVIVSQRTIEKLEHAYEEQIVTEATCTTEGMKKYVCTYCQDEYTETFALEAYEAWEIYEMIAPSIAEVYVYDVDGVRFSSGSGFVYDANGIIVTNYHVIEEGCSAKVYVNGQYYDVQRVLAYDPNIDLAVLAINATDLPALPVCEEPMKVGEKVYVLGMPKGYYGTFSDGIVSCANRVVDGVAHIQHTASTAAGSSGSPLVNKYGEVIGIHAWVRANAEELKFAISVSELNNLSCVKSMTLQEVYEKECGTFGVLRDYIIENGTYNEERRVYRVELKYTVYGNTENTYLAYYRVEDNQIQISLYSQYNTYFSQMYLIIDEITNTYEWAICNSYDEYLSGYVNANTFDDESELEYAYYEGSGDEPLDTYCAVATSSFVLLCSYLNSNLAPAGIDAEDLGFVNFADY